MLPVELGTTLIAEDVTEEEVRRALLRNAAGTGVAAEVAAHEETDAETETGTEAGIDTGADAAAGGR